MAFVLPIAFRDIPVYLHESAFYCSLNAEDPDGIIEIPAEFYKTDDLIENDQDLLLFLRVAKFWGIDTIPNSITEFCISNELPIAEQIDDRTSQFMIDVNDIFRGNRYSSSTLSRAVLRQRSEVVRRLAEMKACFDNHDAIGYAARAGRLDYLELLHAHGYTGDGNECMSAAKGDHVHCMKYLHEKNGVALNLMTLAAIKNDAVQCLQYALSYGGFSSFEQASHWYWMVWAGSAKCIRYAHEQGDPLPENMCVDLIQARAQNKRVFGSSDYTQCLEYALENGYTAMPHSCQLACENGMADMLRMLHEHGSVVNHFCANKAAKAGHLECLVYLHEVGCPWNSDTSDEAVLAGKLDCLRYALEHGCAVSRDILLHAARRNHVHVLQYLIEVHGVYMPEDSSLFEAAFERFHLESVVYLIDIGCPFVDFSFFWLSALQPLDDERFLKCIVYSVEHGWKNAASLVPTVQRESYALSRCNKYLTALCYEDCS